jgi:hypothetical protein
MPLRLLHLSALLGIPAVAVTLWAWGQPLTSASGEFHLWVNSIWSSENSQQVADWYSLSHIIHGTLIALIGKAVVRWTGFAPIYLVAIATGVGWEIVEHTDWVFERFRNAALYRGYVGDTVLNAVADYLFMMGGFFVAWALRVPVALGLTLFLEASSALFARDSLSLAVVSFIHPVPALEAWQDEINPWTHPELLNDTQ